MAEALRERLASVARALARGGVPAVCGEDENPYQISTHWSGTRDEMERFLSRRLTTDETLLLTLSRCYGTGIGTLESAGLIREFWPAGNPRGLYYSWAFLAERLAGA